MIQKKQLKPLLMSLHVGVVPGGTATFSFAEDFLELIIIFGDVSKGLGIMIFCSS